MRYVNVYIHLVYQISLIEVSKLMSHCHHFKAADFSHKTKQFNYPTTCIRNMFNRVDHSPIIKFIINPTAFPLGKLCACWIGNL